MSPQQPRPGVGGARKNLKSSELAPSPPTSAPANQPSKRPPPRSSRWLLAVAWSALLTALLAVGALGWGVYRYGSLLERAEAADDGSPDSSTKRAGLEASESSSSSGDEPKHLGDVVPHTRRALVGGIEVIDVGVSDEPLLTVLQKQQRLAAQNAQRVLLMLTSQGCKPCRGVDEALADPAMQHALDRVRLVRVDVDVFKEEMRLLRIPSSHYPAFILLDEDVQPLDAVHGGEWDADIAENIAPVLDAFLRGNFRDRRHENWSPTTSGTQL